ncbi:Hypothetical protein c3054 [Escherichia coli CFT073]|uniref:Uncharacterized protein n=1 Tax=Escherichia coli O6:H1 (strain CFT073 / ATCC 700928 / UPEC) TaxID=199310 RepID=A0A0H2V9N3_ECOL6|nr:Hypothetical protein c3054 [Escherichia coli CFT073]
MPRLARKVFTRAAALSLSVIDITKPQLLFCFTFAFIVRNGGFDRVFCQNRTVNFHRRQFKFFSNIGVFDSLRFVERLPFHPFGDQGAGSDSRTAAVSFKTRVFNDTFIVDFNLQLHHVATGRRTHHAAADVLVVVVKGTHVTRILVMVDNFFAVSHYKFS